VGEEEYEFAGGNGNGAVERGRVTSSKNTGAYNHVSFQQQQHGLRQEQQQQHSAPTLVSAPVPARPAPAPVSTAASDARSRQIIVS
jgi:hypothetical protein